MVLRETFCEITFKFLPRHFNRTYLSNRILQIEFYEGHFTWDSILQCIKKATTPGQLQWKSHLIHWSLDLHKAQALLN